jgi:hypothetical protein
MSEHDHDEIARRLRESGTVPAPERLRGEVMDQVRAEPRRRRARRSFLMPALPYAAAAAVLAALVLALSHLGGSGSSGSAEGGGASAAIHSPSAARPSKDAAGGEEALGYQAIFHIPPAALRRPTLAPYVRAGTPAAKTVVLAVPASRFNDYRQRLRAIQERARGDHTVRVILRPTPP